MTIGPVSPIDLIVGPSVDQAALRAEMAQPLPAVRPASFTDMLLDGVDAASIKLVEADRLVRQAVLDDSVPLHRVTYALEEARISLELMIQMRNRLVDAAQQIMNMQV